MSADPSAGSTPRPAGPPSGRTAGPSALRIVHVYPHLLGTYGDAGNALVLRRRAEERGIAVTVLPVQPGQAVPRDGDIYLVGGGEDAKQTAAAQELRADGGLAAAVARGAAVLGICAGYQLLGEVFPGAGGVATEGVGLLDVRTERLPRRAVGNVLAVSGWDLGLPDLIGFENHGGATTVGPSAAPMARIEVGVGNGDGSRTEGAVQNRVVGTYLHGPVLALNPGLADWLLSTITGPLPGLDDRLCESLRRHRLDEVIPATARADRRRALLSTLRRRDDRPSGAAASLSGSGSPAGS
jgi:lipid II isoglutaminyl synthase (glutamine-hydrolysing)